MKTNIDSQALGLAKTRMNLDFGVCPKIPPELRDVVVSFYYWFHIFAGRAIANEVLPMEVLSSGNVAGSLRLWIGDVAYWTSSIKAVPDFIKGFENITETRARCYLLS